MTIIMCPQCEKNTAKLDKMEIVMQKGSDQVSELHNTCGKLLATLEQIAQCCGEDPEAEDANLKEIVTLLVNTAQQRLRTIAD